MTNDENIDIDPEDPDETTQPLWRCKACGERFLDAIEMPGRHVFVPGESHRWVNATRHCPFCRSTKLERWK